MKGTFFFDPTDQIYKDHFPGKPVVPGSVIVNAFMAAAKKEGILGDPVVVRDFRFRKFVSPDVYAYRMKVKGDYIICQMFVDDSNDTQPLVTGKFKR